MLRSFQELKQDAVKVFLSDIYQMTLAHDRRRHRYYNVYPLVGHPASASLAPDIVEMIVHGDEPDAVTPHRLLRPFSVLWEEQRAELGGEGVDIQVP